MAYLGNAPVVGDSTNSFRLLDDIASFTLTFDATDTSVVSISGDTLSFTNHRFVTGQKVTYTDGGGTAIGGLTDGTSYFIIKVDQNTIKLATNASNAASSTAINLTSGAAGGSHTLKVAFDGVNTKFKATFNNGKKAKISRAGQISLSINGVIQQPQDSSSPSVGYGVEADSTIVFSTAPVATDKVFATFIGEVAASFDIEDNTIDNFTGDGSTTIFNLSKEVPSSQDVLVTLDGVTQHPSDGSTTRSYSVIDQALTFVSAPATGVAIQARHIGFAGATTSAVTGFYGRTGNAALISTDDISVQNISAGIATFNTISVGGTVSIGGTLTYEDVTNIDSVGLITARNGIVVGSGITLSKDGDGFFTGIVTATSYYGDGSNLSNITSTTINNNADNRLITGSGTANTLEGEANITFDGTNLDLGDSKKIRLGASQDLEFYHDGSNSYIKENGTGGLYQQTNGNGIFLQKTDGENMANFVTGGAVELYHNNVKTAYTKSSGFEIKGGNTSDETELQIIGNEGQNASILLGADDGDDNADYWRMYAQASDGAFTLKNYAAGSYETSIKANGNGNVELYFDNSKKFETTTNGAEITGRLDLTGGYLSVDDNYAVLMGTGGDAQLYHSGSHQYLLNTTGNIYLMPKASETGISIVPDGAVNLYYDNTLSLYTTSTGFRTSGQGEFDGGIRLTDTRSIDFGDSADLQIDHSGTNSQIYHDGTGHLYIGTQGSGEELYLFANDNVRIQTAGNEDAIKCLKDGMVQLYYDNDLRIFTNSDGMQVKNETLLRFKKETSTSGEVTAIQFEKDNPTNVVGRIRYDNGQTHYNTTSDYRLKENNVAITDGITRISQLKPYRFNFKVDPSKTVDGFFAHEVSSVVPEAISGEKDAVRDVLYNAQDVIDGTLPDGKSIGDVKESGVIDPQEIDQAKLVPLLVAAVQELIAEVEKLKSS